MCSIPLQQVNLRYHKPHVHSASPDRTNIPVQVGLQHHYDLQLYALVCLPKEQVERGYHIFPASIPYLDITSNSASTFYTVYILKHPRPLLYTPLTSARVQLRDGKGVGVKTLYNII